MSDSIGIPSAWSAASPVSSWRTCRLPRITARAGRSLRTRRQEARSGEKSDDRDRGGEIATASPIVLHRGMVREAGAVGAPSPSRPARSGLPATHSRTSARDRVLSTSLTSIQARRAWVTPHPKVVEFGDLVGVGVDGQRHAHADRTTGAFDGEVEPVRRAVHLEDRASPRRLSTVHRVPVQVEVVAPIMRPDGWAITSTCRLRIPLRVRQVAPPSTGAAKRGPRRRPGRTGPASRPG